MNQTGILFTSAKLSDILHRPVIIPDSKINNEINIIFFSFVTDIPLSIELTAVLFTPEERAIIAQAVHNEGLQLGIILPTLNSAPDHHSTQSQSLIFSY